MCAFFPELIGKWGVGMKTKETEKIVLYAIRDMSKSARDKFHNPDDIRPISYSPAVVLDMPLGTASAIWEGNERMIERVRELAARKGCSGKYQARVARGGIGGGIGIATVKHNLRNNNTSTRDKGFPTLIQELEV